MCDAPFDTTASHQFWCSFWHGTPSFRNPVTGHSIPCCRTEKQCHSLHWLLSLPLLLYHYSPLIPLSIQTDKVFQGPLMKWRQRHIYAASASLIRNTWECITISVIFSAVGPRAAEREREKIGIEGNRIWEGNNLSEQEDDKMKRVRLTWRDLLSHVI